MATLDIRTMEYVDCKTNEQHIDIINANYKHVQEGESFVWDWVFKVKSPTELPSFHPYWKWEVQQDRTKSFYYTKSKYEECVKDQKKIKYHFNNTTSLNDIRNKMIWYAETGGLQHELIKFKVEDFINTQIEQFKARTNG